MAYKCDVCGKKPSVGNRKQERGKPKYLGGNGRKTTGISKRLFKPNLQKVKVQQGDKVVSMRVCTACLRAGLVQKAVKRAVFTVPEPV